MTRPDLRDFTRAPVRSRIEAAFLAAGGGAETPDVARFKADRIGALRGTVVEIGPGPGVNMRHYADGVKVIAIEPNPAMHQRLWAEAVASRVDLEIRGIHGEVMDVEDDAADAVVGTLVLCGVDDAERVLDEVARVLKPGAPYLFYEHVAAPPNTPTARGQRLLKAPHRWMFNGCEVDRDTLPLIEARFADVESEASDGGFAAVHTRSRVLGTARTPER